MKKMPTIFLRPETGNRSLVTRTPHPDCGWVFRGEGTATQKIDGTCCLVRGGKLLKRRMVRDGSKAPNDFEPVDSDSITGKTFGWVPVDFGDKSNQWHKEAWDCAGGNYPDGTYELVGPKIQDNAEGLDFHRLEWHQGAKFYTDVPRDFDGLKSWLSDKDIEGLVFQHEDGRMAKVKKSDFGMKRSPKL